MDSSLLSTNLDTTKIDVSFTTQPIYVTGNYLKYGRGISQTPWQVDGVQLVG